MRTYAPKRHYLTVSLWVTKKHYSCNKKRVEPLNSVLPCLLYVNNKNGPMSVLDNENRNATLTYIDSL